MPAKVEILITYCIYFAERMKVWELFWNLSWSIKIKLKMSETNCSLEFHPNTYSVSICGRKECIPINEVIRLIHREENDGLGSIYERVSLLLESLLVWVEMKISLGAIQYVEDLQKFVCVGKMTIIDLGIQWQLQVLPTLLETIWHSCFSAEHTSELVTHFLALHHYEIRCYIDALLEFTIEFVRTVGKTWSHYAIMIGKKKYKNKEV